MANVLKISRGHSMPPTFTNAHEWFHYAFSNTEIKGEVKNVKYSYSQLNTTVSAQQNIHIQLIYM
jgi:hypothetical protein